MLNNIVDSDKTMFGIFNCEQLFRDVWDGSFADAMDEKWIAARRTGRRVGKGKSAHGPSPSELVSVSTYVATSSIWA